MIPYGRQEVTADDIDAVVAVLRSEFLTQGPAVPRFEASLAASTGAAHAVVVSSATAALHIACLVLGVGPGQRVWTSPISFVASANCARYCGADVDFVDIDPVTYNMCPRALETKLIAAERAGRLPSVVIPVHLCGQPCDMERIQALAVRFGFKVIEDAAHAIGAQYLDEPVGNCRYSDITVFSFHPVKIITTGEGGAALTNDPALAARMALLRSHGITRDAGQMQREVDGGWYYEQQELGFHYRLTDIQAALGLSQMPRLAGYLARRRELARRYDESLAGLPLRTPWQHPDGASAWHLYVVRLQGATSHKFRRAVFDALRAGGIGVNVHYIPVHTQPYYGRMGFRTGDFPVAESYYNDALTLPLYPTMTEAQQDLVVSCLRDTLRAY